MSKQFREIHPEELGRNIFELIGHNWMLICAKDENNNISGANCMTASWGGAGILWGKPVCTVYIRPQRYTFGLTEQSDRISLCFPGEEYRNALVYCGRNSGRSEDKISKAGLSCEYIDNVPCIRESEIIIIGKKLYSDMLKEECFNDRSPLSNYSAKDYHKFYILEIEKVLISE